MRRDDVNAVQCLRCGDVIESTHRHDFKWCRGRHVAVDGGPAYRRRIGGFTDARELRTRAALAAALRGTRVWLHVVPRGTGSGREWCVVVNRHTKGATGAVLTREPTQAVALTAARDEGARLWATGIPAQVVLHGSTGQIKRDRTYGHDPKRSKG